MRPTLTCFSVQNISVRPSEFGLSFNACYGRFAHVPFAEDPALRSSTSLAQTLALRQKGNTFSPKNNPMDTVRYDWYSVRKACLSVVGSFRKSVVGSFLSAVSAPEDLVSPSHISAETGHLFRSTRLVNEYHEKR